MASARDQAKGSPFISAMREHIKNDGEEKHFMETTQDVKFNLFSSEYFSIQLHVDDLMTPLFYLPLNDNYKGRNIFIIVYLIR